MEIIGMIQKKMKSEEDKLKKKQDEVQSIKMKLQGFMKKEGATLLTRDFTDEIYEQKNNIDKKLFVSSHESSMFSDVLVVLPATKA